MKKFLLLAVFALVAGCSNPSSVDYHSTITVGLDTEIPVTYMSNNEIIVNKCSGIATTGSLYFYIPWATIDGSCDCKVRSCLIPDGSITVDGKQFDGLKCLILQDVNNSWYVEVVRNDSNLSMSVGAKVEIKSFQVRW